MTRLNMSLKIILSCNLIITLINTKLLHVETDYIVYDIMDKDKKNSILIFIKINKQRNDLTRYLTRVEVVGRDQKGYINAINLPSSRRPDIH